MANGFARVKGRDWNPNRSFKSFFFWNLFLPDREAYQFVFLVQDWLGIPKPDEKEIDQIGYFCLEELPSPMSNLVIHRIQDAVSDTTKPIMREQHLKDRLV